MDEFAERVSGVSKEVADVPAVLFADDVQLTAKNVISTTGAARYSYKMGNGKPNELEYKRPGRVKFSYLQRLAINNSFFPGNP